MKGYELSLDGQIAESAYVFAMHTPSNSTSTLARFLK